MVRTRASHLVVWPSYFDIRKTRNEGRRVSKKFAVEKPTLEQVYEAIKTLGLEATPCKEKSYPGSWWAKEGMVLVPKGTPKTKLIKNIAEKLKKA